MERASLLTPRSREVASYSNFLNLLNKTPNRLSIHPHGLGDLAYAPAEMLSLDNLININDFFSDCVTYIKLIFGLHAIVLSYNHSYSLGLMAIFIESIPWYY